MLSGSSALNSSLRELVLAGDLIVDELEAAEAGDPDDLLDLLDDVADRARAIAALVEDRNLAERASIGASAAGLHRHRLEQVAIELEQLMARARQVLQVVNLVGLVDLLQLAVAPVLQQLGPHQVGLALHDRVGMIQCFFGLERRMESAEDDRHAAFAELVAELIRAQRRADRGGHADQVPAAVEVDVLEAFVAQRHVVVVGRQSRHQRNHQSHDQPPARLMRRAVQMDGRRLNQENSRLLAFILPPPAGLDSRSYRLSVFIDDAVRPVIHIRAKANT